MNTDFPFSPLDKHESSQDSNILGHIIVVATPIGNLGDISFRAKKILETVDIILCEDTRVTTKLLTAYSLSSPLESLHEHNESQRINEILSWVKNGKTIALVSDAGTPLLSDPGYRLIKSAIEQNIKISGVPGANAALMALTLSGLPPYPYLFMGFPPSRSNARQESFAKIRAAERSGLSATLIWYEAPHRIINTLEDLRTVFGPERNAVVARELTKKFEEIHRHSVEGLIDYFSHHPARGEMTVLLAPPKAEEINEDDLDNRLIQALQTLSIRDAASVVATAVHLPKRIIYQRALELSKTL